MLELIAEHGFKLEFIARIVGGDGHHPGGGALAEIQALRAFQNLQLAHVHVGVVDEAADVDHHSIHVDGHGLVEGGADRAGADAAQVKVGAVAGAAVVDVEAGDQLGGFRQGADVVALQIRLRQRRHGYRHVLQGLLLLAGGDDDFLDHIAAGAAFLGLGGHCRG